jgi:D-alanine-D-alanine ligase
MKLKSNILLLYGGGGNEHDVSIVSKDFYKSSLEKTNKYQIHEVEIQKNKVWDLKSPKAEVYLSGNKQLCHHQTHKPVVENIDYVIPCFHGYPGETGHIQGLLDTLSLPYFGNGVEVSALCMNKITTKLWLQHLNIPVVEFMVLTNPQDELEQKNAESFFKQFQHIFVKASSEGSSVGVFSVKNFSELRSTILKAFEYSQFVLLERAVQGREIEISTYHYGEEIIATQPGEIFCPGEFYDFHEKYSKASKATTTPVAKDIDPQIIKSLQNTCLKIFKSLKFKDLARIDFFLEKNNRFYVNEINTFPGSTPISLFPQMMIHFGHNFTDYLDLAIERDLRNFRKKPT